MTQSPNSSSKKSAHNHKTKLKNFAKSEGKKALAYYLLKFLNKRRHRSYLHRRLYQLISQLIYKHLK